MPSELPRHDLDAAEAAVIFAQSVRRTHRRRTNKDSKQRAEDIALARARLSEAMEPLRSEIGRFTYGPQTDIAERNRDEIRRMSKRIQDERRKLWKMQNPKRKEPSTP